MSGTGGWATLFELELAHVRAEARGPDPEEPDEDFEPDEWPYPDEDPPDPL